MVDALLTTFGLKEHAGLLSIALRKTGAYIGGDAVLTVHLREKIPDDQALEIFYTESVKAPAEITSVLFNTLFTAAGYGGCETYRVILDRVLFRNASPTIAWTHPTLHRTIYLYIREFEAPPLYTTCDFNVCQFYLELTPYRGKFILSSVLTPEIAEEIRTKRVMRIANIAGQNLTDMLVKLHRYYLRGFAIEKKESKECSCMCGHAHTTEAVRRLNLKEAIHFVSEQHALADHPPEDEDEDETGDTHSYYQGENAEPPEEGEDIDRDEE